MDSRKEVNVLSFDGGGSRGVMEMIILEDIMNSATLLTTEPKKIEPWLASKSFFQMADERNSFCTLLSNVQEPIHPTSKIKNNMKLIQNLI